MKYNQHINQQVFIMSVDKKREITIRIGESVMEDYLLSVFQYSKQELLKSNDYTCQFGLSLSEEKIEELSKLFEINDVLNDVEGILQGKYDNVDESRFRYIGKINEQ